MMMIPTWVNLAGYDASTAAEWARNVHTWGKLLEGHPDVKAYIEAVQAMSAMLKEALHCTPTVSAFAAAAKSYHKIMNPHFPKVTMLIYEHALLMHVHTLLNHGSLLDGSSWFLEAYNNVWKQQPMCHSNGGGGKATTPFEETDDKQSETGRARQRANSAANEDLSILKAVWSCSHSHVLHFAAKWGAEGMEDTIPQAFQGQP
jgi:hypothetical protein